MEDGVSKVVIIGSGPAGLTAGIYCSRAGLEPVLYMGSKYGGQLMVTSEVENFPGFRDPILGPELMDQMKTQAERLGTKLIQDDVTEVDLRSYPFVIKTAIGGEARSEPYHRERREPPASEPRVRDEADGQGSLQLRGLRRFLLQGEEAGGRGRGRHAPWRRPPTWPSWPAA